MAERGLTAKQERFCRILVEQGCSASDAYRQAYDCANTKPPSVQRMAHGLMVNVKVSSRVAELREKAAKASIVTREGHLAALERLRNEASAVGAYGPAVRAEEARGKVAGLYVERQEHVVTGKVTIYIPDNGRDGR